MFFCLAFKNTGICSVLCISGPKSIGIYSIFCVFAWLPPTTLKRKNVVIYSILWLPKSEKSSEKCVKTVLFSDFWDLQNASSNFTLFLSTPDREKRENPTRLKDFWGGSAAGARPRVAKAMLSFPTLHGEASPDFWADAPRRLRRTTRPSISSQCGRESYWMRTCFRNIFLRFFGTYLLE